MEQDKKEFLSDAEIFKALSDAEKNYDELLKINELISETELQTFQEYYHRDINHPLSIVIKE